MTFNCKIFPIKVITETISICHFYLIFYLQLLFTIRWYYSNVFYCFETFLLGNRIYNYNIKTFTIYITLLLLKSHYKIFLFNFLQLLFIFTFSKLEVFMNLLFIFFGGNLKGLFINFLKNISLKLFGSKVILSFL